MSPSIEIRRRACLKLLAGGMAGAFLPPAWGQSKTDSTPKVPAAKFIEKGSDEFEFAYPGMRGVLRGGNLHGFELTQGADGKRLTKDCCLNVEHYFATGNQTGVFVPRRQASISMRQVSESSIEMTIAPAGGWQTSVKVIYSLLPDRILEASYEFTFGADYPLMEVFISSYNPDNIFPFVTLQGGLAQPPIAGNEHKFWPRGPAEAAMLSDGRYRYLEPYDCHAAVTADFYEYPIQVIPTSPGWYLFNLVEREECASLHANIKWGAWGDFSLIGRDVKKDEVVKAKAWLGYVPLSHPLQVMEWQDRLAPGNKAEKKS